MIQAEFARHRDPSSCYPAVLSSTPTRTYADFMPESTHTSLFLRACAGQSVPRPPVWIMRQAGRYLPEYQKFRARHSFVEMCTTPELALEITLQPIRRFDFDAAVVFYDILFLPEAMGAPLEFTERGPVFRTSLRSQADIDALEEPDVTADAPGRGTGAVLRTLTALRRELATDKAVLGFAGAPFTLAAYLVEGNFRRSGDRIRRMLYEMPATVHSLLERLTAATCTYVRAQVQSGADAVQIFDTWAGLLSQRDFDEFALPYLQRIFAVLAETDTPRILYANGGSHLLESLARCGATGLSVDWRTPLREVRQRVGGELVLQGNLEPSSLFGPPETVRAEVTRVLDEMGGDARYVFNLGHGILPETPVASVETLVETVRGR